jgi:hypothetical protein
MFIDLLPSYDLDIQRVALRPQGQSALHLRKIQTGGSKPEAELCASSEWNSRIGTPRAVPPRHKRMPLLVGRRRQKIPGVVGPYVRKHGRHSGYFPYGSDHYEYQKLRGAQGRTFCNHSRTVKRACAERYERTVNDPRKRLTGRRIRNAAAPPAAPLREGNAHSGSCVNGTARPLARGSLVHGAHPIGLSTWRRDGPRAAGRSP